MGTEFLKKFLKKEIFCLAKYQMEKYLVLAGSVFGKKKEAALL
jgi:hypothetical protein